MAKTRGGLPFPENADEVGDRDFWKGWALALDAKLAESEDWAKKAMNLANDALGRVDELERKPAPKIPEPEPVDLTPLERRLTALEGREMPVDNTERIDRLTTQLRQLQALHGLSDKQLDALDQED